MAEVAEESEAPRMKGGDIESKILEAMKARILHFKEQSDSLTFVNVRRVLEQGLGLEPSALDAHKGFVKEHLLKCLEGGGEDTTSKNYGQIHEKSPTKGEEAVATEENQSKKDTKESSSADEEKVDDSLASELPTGDETANSKTEGSKSASNKKTPTEAMIKSALEKRGSYIKANIEKLTMGELRRVLEKDLKLEMHSLDPFKKFINQQLDEVLESCVDPQPVKNVKKNVKKSQKKPAPEEISEVSSGPASFESEEEDEVKPKKRSVTKGNVKKNVNKPQKKSAPEEISEESSGPGGFVSEEEEEDEVKPKKRSVTKGKNQNSNGLKKGKTWQRRQTSLQRRGKLLR